MPKDNEAVPQELVEAVQTVYIPAFLKRCEERGYTHITSQEKLADALDVVKQLKSSVDETQEQVNKVATLITQDLLDQTKT